jgi:hypothetical protein
VRSFVVVVLDELPQDPVEVALASDEHPVKALGPRCSDKAFGERVRPRRPYGCPDHPSADRPHHLVEGPDELRVTITNEETDSSALVLEGRCHVAGLLTDPGPDRMGRHPGQEDLPSIEVDKEQHVEPPKRDGINVEEVTGEAAGGLGPEELRRRGA